MATRKRDPNTNPSSAPGLSADQSATIGAGLPRPITDLPAIPAAPVGRPASTSTVLGAPTAGSPASASAAGTSSSASGSGAINFGMMGSVLPQGLGAPPPKLPIPPPPPTTAPTTTMTPPPEAPERTKPNPDQGWTPPNVPPYDPNNPQDRLKKKQQYQQTHPGYDHGGAGGQVGDATPYSEIEPPPPHPTDADRLAAQQGDEKARKILRDFREWSDRNNAYQAEQEREGHIAKQGAGAFNMKNAYGQQAANIDILGRRVAEVHTNEKTGKNELVWRPMTDQEYRDITNYQNQVASKQGVGFSKAWGSDYLGEVQRKELESLVKHGYTTLDPRFNVYWHRGAAAPGDYQHYTFLDQYGRKTTMPAGWTQPGKDGSAAAPPPVAALPGIPAPPPATTSGVVPGYDTPPGQPTQFGGTPVPGETLPGAPGNQIPTPVLPITPVPAPTPTPTPAPPPPPASTQPPPGITPPPGLPPSPASASSAPAGSLPTAPAAAPSPSTLQAPPLPTPGQPQAPAAAPGGPIVLDHTPTPQEIASIGSGTIQTPLMSIIVNPGVPPRYILNAAGQEAYRHAKVAKMKQFGTHPFAAIPGAPTPPVEPGQPTFNPFTGQWAE